MKVQEGTPQQQGIWSPRKEINMIKEALKKDYLYSNVELRTLKGRLSAMYTVNQQLERTNGFGK